MNTAIHAIYENGIFRPMQPVDLPDQCEVEVEVRAIAAEQRFPEEGMSALSDRDRDRFLQLIENPPPPTAALRQAAWEYREQHG
jgi:predicted DNA-binding antitoxin AbrB/MazE fold protein